MPLNVPDDLHSIEYYREHGRGQREHVYTERIDDQGFVLVHDPDKIQEWLARYARICADDYLARVRAQPGEWLVHVYRLRDGERHHIVSIRMHWHGILRSDNGGG